MLVFFFQLQRFPSEGWPASPVPCRKCEKHRVGWLVAPVAAAVFFIFLWNAALDLVIGGGVLFAPRGFGDRAYRRLMGY